MCTFRVLIPLGAYLRAGRNINPPTSRPPHVSDGKEIDKDREAPRGVTRWTLDTSSKVVKELSIIQLSNPTTSMRHATSLDLWY